jgi:uroporphyrin-III C-methyltransferase / precorrin-2 dehydrogenase / sirohydrochlorin ferrochelatase
MKFLPISLNIQNRKILVVGGGHVAAHKLATLCQFTHAVELCGIKISPEVRRYPITILERPYGEDLLEGKGLVYACTDDRALNRRIGEDSRRRGILANVSDDPEACDFTSPALFKKDFMSVAVSSNAQDVRRAISWRNKIKKFIEAMPESWKSVSPASESKKGKVWLVGFGPGDPALLTFKADRILSQADVIFYDDLIDDSVLRRYPAKAVYVGKRKGYHAVEQQDINEQMSAAAGEGLTVVRLKGGDPSIFGRVGEEISFLRARDIEMEMIPGVTAACASAAALCVSLTQRDLSSEIVIRTGHGGQESEKVESRPGTVVYYMAATCLKKIALDLLTEGFDPKTPAVIVERAGLPQESRRKMTLETLGDQQADSPATVIVGDVVGLLNHAEHFL